MHENRVVILPQEEKTLEPTHLSLLAFHTQQVLWLVLSVHPQLSASPHYKPENIENLLVNSKIGQDQFPKGHQI